MSLHKNPKYQIPALIEALKRHRLEHDTPSQLSDSFRAGWFAALAAAAPDMTDAYAGARDVNSRRVTELEAQLGRWGGWR